MKTSIEFMFFHSFFVSLLLCGLSFLIYRRLKSVQFFHLSEFWASLATMMIISYIFRSDNPFIVGISMIGWIWPLKTIFTVMEDLSGVETNYRTNTIILSVGAFITLALASYALPFEVYTTPFCLAVGTAGVYSLRHVYRNRKNEFSILGNATFVLLGVFLAIRMLFPLWRLSEYNVYGIAAHLLCLIGLGVSTLAYYMEVMKDLHEAQLTSVIKERNDQLFGQSKYSELGMMSAGIAHEINNPLAIIQAKVTQLLRVHRDPEKQQFVSDGLEQILYTSERINRTIQGVRDFVHQDERVPNEQIDIKTLVDDVLAFCGQRMKNHGVNLRFYGLEDYTIRGHKIQLEQVLLNLLNNSFDAIEFLPDKWIEMSVHETPTTVQMYFKDSGPGIPPEVATRMMEPFYTTKKIGKGTGLGLALARGIVEKHGGSLAYISNARHTTFLLELPKEGPPPELFKPTEQPQIH